MIRGDDPGRRDIYITVEEPTETRHVVTNEVISTWAAFARVYGQQMKPPESVEGFEADQQVARQTSRYKIPYLAGLTEKMRFNITGEYHYVRGIELWDRRKFQVVTTEKRDNV
jgi:head-tail adaptor